MPPTTAPFQKFKKHIDDAFRAGDGRKADDYVVIASKENQKRMQQRR
jgi:hypothetical protein